MGNGSEPADFDLNDFRRQLLQIKRLGSFRDIMRLIPGLGSVLGGAEALDVDLGGEIVRIQGIIDSMTAEERANPGQIDPSRGRRIAAGAGVCNAEVVSLIKQFEILASMVKQMASMTTFEKVRDLNGLGKSDALGPESRLGLTTPASTRFRFNGSGGPRGRSTRSRSRSVTSRSTSRCRPGTGRRSDGSGRSWPATVGNRRARSPGSPIGTATSVSGISSPMNKRLGG